MESKIILHMKIFVSNKLKLLVGALAQELDTSLSSSLAEETIVVQSIGM
jgi:hypothetical protein